MEEPSERRSSINRLSASKDKYAWMMHFIYEHERINVVKIIVKR